jgi:twitching motility protein PilT
VAIGTLFKSGSKDLLERIKTKNFGSPEERSQAYAQLAQSTDVKLVEAVQFLFTPDAELRKAVGAMLAARKDPATVAVVVKALSGRPEAARRAALNILASLPIGDVAAQVGVLMETPEKGDRAEMRKLATEALLDMPLTQATIPLLTKVIEQGQAGHRLRAVQRFAEVAQAGNVPFFEKLLDDPDESLRLAAYQLIIKFAGPEKLDLLVKRVPDEPYGTQQVLVEAIRKLAPQAGAQATEQVLDLLVSGNTGLRSVALKILMSFPDRVATIRSFISYSQKLQGWVRDRALESMREFGQDVIEPALALVRDPDPDVRGAALMLLAGYDDPRVAEAAVLVLQDKDWWLAINAADMLGTLGDPRAVPALVEALKNEEVRWSAVEALGRIGGPQALQALSQLTRDQRPEIRIEALSALATSEDERVLPILQASAEGDQDKWVRTRAFEMLQGLARKKSANLDEAAVAAAVNSSELSAGAPMAHQLLALARREGASDLHVSVDSVPMIRVGGELRRLQGEPLTEEQAAGLLVPLLDERQRSLLDENHQLDACFHVVNDGRYRGNIFRDRKGLNGVFRVIPEKPPTITELGLPNDLSDIARYHQGVIIVTGPSGSGKSTTLAALVNLVNETRRDHVLTIEDPVEFVHPFKSSLINQREVGKHTASFGASLRAALREDPDVIVIGEMRDKETTELSLTAAETGHVVLSTLNATTAAKAVDRVIATFPVDEQSQVRESFAGALKVIVAQALVQSADGKGLVGCFEILKGTLSIANCIRDGKTFQIPSIMQIGSKSGMRTFDDSLMDLVRAGKVTAETAYLRANRKELFEPLVAPKFLEDLLA